MQNILVDRRSSQPVTAGEMAQRLQCYPADTKVVLVFDWGEPVLDDTYLTLELPTLSITNTPESQARVSEQQEAHSG
jgi:hypothetical protein